MRTLVAAAATLAATAVAGAALAARQWVNGPLVSDIRPLIGVAAVFAVLALLQHLQERLAAHDAPPKPPAAKPPAGKSPGGKSPAEKSPGAASDSPAAAAETPQP